MFIGALFGLIFVQGNVRVLMKATRMKNLLLTLCVARIVKDQLKKKMRETMMVAKVPSDNRTSNYHL